MSDFPNDFSAFYVAIITVVSTLAWAVSLYNARAARVSNVSDDEMQKGIRFARTTGGRP